MEETLKIWCVQVPRGPGPLAPVGAPPPVCLHLPTSESQLRHTYTSPEIAQSTITIAWLSRCSATAGGPGERVSRVDRKGPFPVAAAIERLSLCRIGPVKVWAALDRRCH